MHRLLKSYIKSVLNEAGGWHGLGKGPEAGVYYRNEPKPKRSRRADPAAKKWDNMSPEQRKKFLEFVYFSMIAVPSSEHAAYKKVFDEGSQLSWKEFVAWGKLDVDDIRYNIHHNSWNR